MASAAAAKDSARAVGDEQGDVAKLLIKILSVLVFLGTIMTWVASPTDKYSKVWLPRLKASIGQTTYLGSQGVTTLIYMFPMLLLACMGCVYLHFNEKKNRKMSHRKDSLAVVKRPMIVRAPLGIVSGVDLGLLVLFLALLVWSLTVYLTNSFANVTPQMAAKYGEKVWQSKLERAAVVIGKTGNICLAFMFYPVARASSLLPLVGLTSESSIKYHIWLGHMAMTFFTAHGLAYVIYWASTHQISEMLKWQKTGVCNSAGALALLAGLILWAATLGRLRRQKFELFFYTHHLYVLFVFFFVLHVKISYALMMLPGFYLFMIDRFLRFLQSRDKARLVSARVLPCNTVELNFSKHPMLSYTPTSTIFVNVPSISKLQWHPFTVTSSSNLEPNNISVMIKSEGSWSTRLHNLLSSSSVGHLEVSVEGPYGPASTDFLTHDALVLVSGGSGITPFISIIRDLIPSSVVGKTQTPKVTLVCAFKHSSELSMLDLILPAAENLPEISNLQLQVEAYVTREDGPSGDTSKNIQTIYFKPNVTRDTPIAAVLGPSSWQWLAAIIASSFVSFLVLVGIITRYYIYPIDHNTNKLYSESWRAILNILVICVSIGTSGSAAVFWNKKYYATEGKHIRNSELPSSKASPSSGIYDADRELEGLPHQSLVQATNIHYGQRPDLKKILSETRGSSCQR